jgi:molybdate transport system regulatory protein
VILFAQETDPTMPYFGPLKVKLQLFCDAETAFGPGKADILEAIDRVGSISGAGRDMGMSYRRTWLLVDTMNRCWREPLVEALPGARKGARLTAFGREVLAAYRALETKVADAVQGPEIRTLSGLLRDHPRASQHEPS